MELGIEIGLEFLKKFNPTEYNRRLAEARDKVSEEFAAPQSLSGSVDSVVEDYMTSTAYFADRYGISKKDAREMRRKFESERPPESPETPLDLTGVSDKLAGQMVRSKASVAKARQGF